MTPLVIGVAGGSGSGKTTFVQRVVEAVGPARAGVLAHDRYYRHRPDLRFAERAALNFDHPESLETPLLAAHVRALGAGHATDVPVYDFARHLRQPDAERFSPHPVLIVEGILVLADAALRALFDLKVFVDVDDATRFERRMARDVRERGRDAASVTAQYAATVRPMFEEFVVPTRQYADLVVTGGGYNEEALERLLTIVRQRSPAISQPTR